MSQANVELVRRADQRADDHPRSPVSDTRPSMHARGEAEPSDPAEYEKAKRDLNDFVDNLRKHFKEEEQIVFLLTLRSQSAG